MIYHPKFNPPPPEIVPRLIWRTDDTPDTLGRRLQIYKDKTIPIYGAFLPCPAVACVRACLCRGVPCVRGGKRVGPAWPGRALPGALFES